VAAATASAIEGERDAQRAVCAPRASQQPTPAAQEGWNAFENGFVGADSHSQTHSQKNSSLFSSPDNLHSKSPRFTQKIAPGIYDFPLEFL